MQTGRSLIRWPAMKKSILILAMLSLTRGTFSQADEPLYIPENKPLDFAWEHDRRLSSGATFYRFYAGNTLVQIVTNFTVLGVTNGMSTITASITFTPALKGATNQLSVTAVEPKLSPPLESSKTTNVFPAQVLGEPLPPQANRKL